MPASPFHETEHEDFTAAHPSHQAFHDLTSPPPTQPDAQQTQEARKLEGLFAGAADGDFKAVNALQTELQSVLQQKNPKEYVDGLNAQFSLDSKSLSRFPGLGIDYYKDGRAEMWSMNGDATNTFAEDANGGIGSDGHSAYPPTPGSQPFSYQNGAMRIQTAPLDAQTPFIQNLEYLATGAQEGNPLDASKLQTVLTALAGSSPAEIAHLNSALSPTAQADGVFDLPTFELSKTGQFVQMNVSYPYEGRHFSESSTGKTGTGSFPPLDRDSNSDGLDVRSEMPSIPSTDIRVPKY